MSKKTAKKESAKRTNTDTEVQQRAKKTKTLQSDDYEKTKEEYSKVQEKLKESLQSGDIEKANALMEDCVKAKKKLEEMEVPIPLLLIVIIMNFIITSSSSDLAAHLDQDLAEGEPQQDEGEVEGDVQDVLS